MLKRMAVFGLAVCICLNLLGLNSVWEKGKHQAQASEPAKAAQVVEGFKVFNGSMVKGGMGFVLSSEKEKAAVALKQIGKPFKKTMTLKSQMKASQPSGPRNGCITFGDNSTLSKACIFIGSGNFVIEGPFVQKVTVTQKFNQGKVFDVALTVNLKGKTVTWKVDGKEVKTKMTKAPASISTVGFLAVNTKTEFGGLQISGD